MVAPPPSWLKSRTFATQLFLSSMPAQRRRRTDGAPDLIAYRALVADDDENYLAWIAHVARRFGFSVTACRNIGKTVEVMNRGERFNIAIIYCEIPRGNWFQVIEALRQ